ncbi:MAG: hypothetical protein LBC99_07125 [Spirochaetota bacterium]|nr:hypothetical protein [Spirochaetota bacterium]
MLAREEIPEKADKEIIWLLAQQLTRAMEKDGVVGVVKIAADIFTSESEQTKALAYRLSTIAERKDWAQETYAYNSLVTAWAEHFFEGKTLRFPGRTAERLQHCQVTQDTSGCVIRSPKPQKITRICYSGMALSASNSPASMFL